MSKRRQVFAVTALGVFMVYLDGTISQLATQRSEFGAILRREGFEGLIATLQRKVKLLAGNVASTS